MKRLFLFLIIISFPLFAQTHSWIQVKEAQAGTQFLIYGDTVYFVNSGTPTISDGGNLYPVKKGMTGDQSSNYYAPDGNNTFARRARVISSGNYLTMGTTFGYGSSGIYSFTATEYIIGSWGRFTRHSQFFPPSVYNSEPNTTYPLSSSYAQSTTNLVDELAVINTDFFTGAIANNGCMSCSPPYAADVYLAVKDKYDGWSYIKVDSAKNPSAPTSANLAQRSICATFQINGTLYIITN